MNPFLHFALENTSSRWLIKPRYFEDVRGIYPIIGSSSHNTVRANLEFIYRDLINTVSPILHNTKGQKRHIVSSEKEQSKTNAAIGSGIDV